MIVQENYVLNGRQYVRTYSSANRYVVGGIPVGEYTEANDPAELNRTYTEGDLIEDVDAPSANRLARIRARIEALRDAAVLPTTKAIYQAILDLFDEE